MSISNRNFLFVIQNDIMGGAEQLLQMLCKEVSKEASRVDVVILRKPIQHSWNSMAPNVYVQYMNTRSYFPGILILIPKLFTLSRTVRYSATFSSNININGLLGWMKGWKGLQTEKLVIRETTSVFLRVTGWKLYFHQLKYRTGYSNADLVICQTEMMRDQFLSHYRPSKNWPLMVLQNPIDLSVVKKKSKDEATHLPYGSEVIVSAGRLIHEKGFDVLIQAMLTIVKTKPNTVLTILGDGPEKGKLEKLVGELGLNDFVNFPGYVNNPMPYFRSASICVVSSRVEGFPNVLLQMMALNDKVVCTRCAGGIENIPGINTCAVSDSQALAKAVLKVLDRVSGPDELKAKQAFLEKNDVSNYWHLLNQALAPNQ